MNANVKKQVIGFDKLVLTVSPDNKADYDGDFMKAIKAEAKCGMIAEFAPPSALNGYRLAVWLLDLGWPSDAAPLLQIAPFDPKKPYLRLEFNPNRLGPAGIAALKELLNLLVPHGWPLFMYGAKASRIDVNIDVGNLALGSVLVRSHCARTTEVWSKKGDIESVEFGTMQTIYLGNKRSSKTFYRVYALGPEKVPTGCAAATRFEAVDKKTRPLLADITKIEFPFKHLIARSVLTAKPAGWDDGLWRMFLKVAGDHGFPAARAMTPAKMLKQADAALDAQPITGLNFMEAWTGWPALIATLGLQTPGSEKGFVPGYAEEHLAA